MQFVLLTITLLFGSNRVSSALGRDMPEANANRRREEGGVVLALLLGLYKLVRPME